MLKNLIKKEFKLAVPPATFLFVIMTFLILIPDYPYIVGIIYFAFQIQIIYSLKAGNKDLEFTAALPVPRCGIVLAKYIATGIIEGVYIVVAVIAALISSLVINKQGSSVGMDANFAFFGLMLIYFSIFNLIFLTKFFKTGYKWGLAYLLAVLAFLIIAAGFEFLIAFVPAIRNAIDSLSPSTFLYQFIVLFLGIAIYAGSMYFGFKKSVKNFESVNL